MAKRIWWATWPGALGMGLISFALAGIGMLTGAIGLLVPPPDQTGIDFEVQTQPLWMTLLWAAQVLAGVTLIVLTVVWARRKWAGYVLLGLGLSAVIGVVGLAQFGIL